MGVETDRIEREIRVDAPVERVYELVSEPGWWIGEEDRGTRTVRREGDVTVVDLPPYGSFPVHVLDADPPRYCSFRSEDDPAKPYTDVTSSLVEFFLTPDGSGTLLRVVESGFVAADLTAEQRAKFLAGNTEGWEMQLAFAKRDREQRAA